MILGIDEVGRGVWAGPLVVGAVILGDTVIEGLTDSKVLTKKRRVELAEQIRQSAAAVGLGWVWPDEIDKDGLGPALRLATKRAVKAVQAQQIPFDEIIIDGTVNFLSDTPLEPYTTTLKKADLLISSVSAAAIVAKVARDAYMVDQAESWPEYGFADNVGYGTAAHRQAISQHGVSPLHRLSIEPLKQFREQPKNVKRRSTKQTTRSIGDAGEDAAAAELELRGHQIVERNWKTKTCEIDIVSTKHGTYYFTEVKHRRSAKHGGGLDAITASKLKQMHFAASVYCKLNGLHDIDQQLIAVATAGDIPAVESFIEIR